MLSQVAESENQVHFRMHQFLARENEKPDAMLYVQEGWACRYRLLSDGRRQITALYLPGDYCDPQWALGGVSSQPVVAITNVRARSEERRVGKGCVSTCCSGWSPEP